MKLLAFAASNSRHSINQALVRHAASLLGEGVELELLDLNDYELPIFSVDREAQLGQPPALAQRFFDKIGQADALLISFAEHNASYTAAFKNLFDWASRIDMAVYQNKPMVMLATSPGKGGGRNVLAAATGSAPYFGGKVVAQLSVPRFHEVFDLERGVLTDPELATALGEAMAALAVEA
ncbi:NADPH-dependent FMN reductase [Ferrimonas marina]|uniref:NAD(P)H-dependent FMN reductase n=1 Tax=Ferrimonas marina TaxID=299255 RepID=A0A1M5RX51_9GAMM|nr:NAD(P)H-dependent oxidoreductase [Ferrimonas marina]SHH30598.1 NAD(P)H-dependent FMN reductase [Ferrimonas marina]